MRVFIDGRQGTTGLKIYDRLMQRNDVEILTIKEELRKDPEEKLKKFNEADVIFLCLPDEAARQSVLLAKDVKARIIDTSTAHRTDRDFAYGFPELSDWHSEKIRCNSRIAVPGCHASGFIALVYPLIQGGLLKKDALLSCFSLTGYSGGGKKMISKYEHDKTLSMSAPNVYATEQMHKHLKEMQFVTGIDRAPIFIPTVGDFYSGMQVCIPVFPEFLTTEMTVEAINEVYRKYYDGEFMVRWEIPENTSMLSANAEQNKDSMKVFALGNSDRIVLYARYDNLGKGASGAAIECMNIAMGIEKTKGLVV